MLKEVITAISKANFVYLIGNGGSATTCSHFANDLLSRGIKAISLVDNVAVFTKIGNDTGYDQVFKEQLQTLFGADDILIAISASGNSPNLLNAVDYVNKTFPYSSMTVAMVGFDGGRLADMCDLVIHTATELGDYEGAEDRHLEICHKIAKILGDN